MIIVHHLNNSKSQRILWLLEELGLAYEIKRYKRTRLGWRRRKCRTLIRWGRRLSLKSTGSL